jgi:hypothetical protein
MRGAKNTLDFIVIGAQKAGTTSLFEHLRHHPEVFLPPGKEVHYFSHDTERTRGWADYIKKNFAAADPSRKWGTVTPSYMVGGVYDTSKTPPDIASRYDERTVPLRIREHSPAVRLIAILRDPVERAHSHYRMASMNGLERRSFDDAIEQLLSPDALERSRRHPKEDTGYITWGEYGRILAGYFDVFPREQILVVFTDELNQAPERLLFRIYEFLGIEPGFVPHNIGTRYRVGGERRYSWLRIGEARRAVSHNQVARSLWKALPDIIRHPIDRAFDRSVYTVDLWNRRAPADLDVPSLTTRRQLREHFEEDAHRLARLIDVPAPWQTPAHIE